ncbi:MAG: recombination regulator RecX [Oxalobacteraceae bacterium]
MPASKPSLKARALRYLAAREHSRLELGRKLQRHVSEGEDIDALLDWLEAQKFLSESRFAESLVHRRASRFGNSRIMSELQSHGLDEATVSSMRASLRSDEDERAWQAWKKKFDMPPDSADARAKQMRFLQQRGFSTSAIQSTMKRIDRGEIGQD